MMLQPPKVSPNQAQLLVIPETAIELGKELGSGAFGTVYKVQLHSFKFIAICHFTVMYLHFKIKSSTSYIATCVYIYVCVHIYVCIYNYILA